MRLVVILMLEVCIRGSVATSLNDMRASYEDVTTAVRSVFMQWTFWVIALPRNHQVFWNVSDFAAISHIEVARLWNSSRTDQRATCYVVSDS